MGKIYAPVNAVDTHRTHRTAVPLDVTLTTEEKRELIRLEKAYNVSIRSSTFVNDYKIRDTTNVGIHFFCVENSFALRVLAKNPNLSPMLVFLINSKINTIDSADKYSTRYALLTNPVVSRDLSLFKMIFNALDNSNDVIARAIPSIIKTASIDLFMFLMPKVADLKNDRLNAQFVAAAYPREKEIFTWLEANFEDLSVLPFSWVLATYGLKD